VQQAKRERLEQLGWTVGDTEDFLELSVEEAAYIAIKLALSDGLRSLRTRSGVTQAELARRMKSSQSRVAKMEAGDPEVSIDLLVRAFLSLGADREAVACAIAT